MNAQNLAKEAERAREMLRKVLFLSILSPLKGIVVILLLGVTPALGAHSGKIPDVGNHLPSLEFKDLLGRTHRLDWDSTQPGARIVFFFESRCADCFREMTFFDSLMGRARDFGLEVYAVEASGLLPAEIDEALRKYRRFYGEPSFPIIPDPDFTLSSPFGVRRVPSTFLVEKHGVVLSRTEWFDDRLAVDLARKTERLLKVKRGFFSFALRDIEVDALAERSLEESLRLRRTSADERARVTRMLAVGDSVPAFEFIDLGGASNQWIPAREETRISIVFFWGALCLPCIQEMAFLDAVFRSTQEQGLEIIAVEGSGLSPERTSRVMERYQRFHPAPSYHIVPDPDFRIGRLFGTGRKIPQTFFISAGGEVVYHSDEFIKGHEGDMTRKIEFALGMENGSLGRILTSTTERYPSADVITEAPSIQAMREREEAFRSNLVRGDTYYGYWEFDKALPHYLRCLEIDSGHVSIHLKVARIYQRKGLLEDALRHWKMVLELEPDHRDARSRVESLRDQGVPEEGYM